MQVKDLMSKDIFVLYADDNLLLAEEIMQWKCIRHVPVVDRHYNLKGLVTHRDMLRASISTLAQLSRSEARDIQAHILLQDIMQTQIFTISPEADIKGGGAGNVAGKNRLSARGGSRTARWHPHGGRFSEVYLGE
jgi:CBS-domain-containing membrane protein